MTSFTEVQTTLDSPQTQAGWAVPVQVDHTRSASQQLATAYLIDGVVLFGVFLVGIAALYIRRLASRETHER